MAISGNQVVAARGLIRISQEELAQKVGIAKSTLVRFEREEGEARPAVRDSIETALRDMGVDFIGDFGVQIKKNAIQEFLGSDCIEKVEDDIFETLKHTGGEVLVYGAEEDKATDYDRFHVEREKKFNITEKIIAKESSTVFLQSKNCYRTFPDDEFTHAYFYVYGDKLAIITSPEYPSIFQAIIINNRSLAETYRKQFMRSWEKAKKIK